MNAFTTPAALVEGRYLTTTPCDDKAFADADTAEPDEPVSCDVCGARWILTLRWEPDERQWYADWTPLRTGQGI